MSENAAKLFAVSYTTNLQLVLQQKGSKLRDRVSTGTHTGSRQAQVVDYMKPVRAGRPQGRFAPMSYQSADFERRWVLPIDCEIPAQLFDNFDKLRMLEDPQSMAVQNSAMAVGRDFDDIIIQAALATAKISTTDGSTLSDETFNTTNFRIASTFGNGATSIGLTYEKLVEARRILRHYEVDLDMEPLTLVIGSTQEADVFSIAQFTQREFGAGTATVQDGKVTRLLGFDVVVSERLEYGSSVRKCLAFAKSGLYLGMWQDMMHDISQRKDLSGLPWQVYTSYACGATRLEPGKLLEIDCADAVTGPVVG
ncbi:MAG: phage capsid protein [Alphaproteobacteria bacterium]